MVNILIMGSNTEFHCLMRKLLNRWIPEARLTAAVGHEAALAVNADLRPEVVLLDISMGSHRELTLIQDIKAGNADAAIFLLANHGYPEYIEAAFAKGADGYFYVGSDTFVEDIYKRVAAVSADAALRVSSGGRCEY